MVFHHAPIPQKGFGDINKHKTFIFYPHRQVNLDLYFITSKQMLSASAIRNLHVMKQSMLIFPKHNKGNGIFCDNTNDAYS